MKKLLLTLCVLLLGTTARADIIDIDNAELMRLAASGVPVIDIRTRPEWTETGIIAGSRLSTFFDERGQYDAAAWLEKLKSQAKPEQAVILVCRSGNRSQTVSRFLSQQAGYKTVYNLRAGIRGWIEEGRPLAPAPSQAACAPPKKC